MPYYNFKCPECEYEFEDRFPMADADGQNVVCPKCAHRGLERLYRGGPVLQKGSESVDASSFSCPTCSDGFCDL